MVVPRVSDPQREHHQLELCRGHNPFHYNDPYPDSDSFDFHFHFDLDHSDFDVRAPAAYFYVCTTSANFYIRGSNDQRIVDLGRTIVLVDLGCPV